MHNPTIKLLAEAYSIIFHFLYTAEYFIDLFVGLSLIIEFPVC